MDWSEPQPLPHPHFATGDLPPSAAAGLPSRVTGAMAATRDWLLTRQHAAGYWCGELEGDTILESEYILLLAWLGREDTSIARKCAAYIVEKQLPNGGWAISGACAPPFGASAEKGTTT